MPYDVYMKAIYEYFRDDLDTETIQNTTQSAVELIEFQEDAVRRAQDSGALRRRTGG